MVWWMPWLNQLIVVCVLAWVIIVLQVIAGVLRSYSCNGIRYTSYETESEQDGDYATMWTRMASFVRGGSGTVWHADVLSTMAVATRTFSVVGLGCQWQMQRVINHEERKGSTLERQKRCFDMLFQETRAAAYRLWYINMFEKAVVLETQATMHGLLRASPKYHDPQAFFAICTSSLSLVNAFYLSWCHLRRLRKAHEEALGKIKKERLKPPQEDQGEEISHDANYARTEWCKARLLGLPCDGTLSMHEELSAAFRSRCAIFLRMRFGIIALFVILVRALVKFVVAAYVCEHGFWNIPQTFQRSTPLGALTYPPSRNELQHEGRRKDRAEGWASTH